MSRSELVYLGCYTGDGGGKGEGIAVARLDPRTGALGAATVAARTPSPSFLTRHPRLPVLYAANELDEGLVTAWRVGDDGRLDALAERPTGGAHPCHLAVTADGAFLLAANYGSGDVTVFPLDVDGVPGTRSDLVAHAGSGPDQERQEGPHAHMVAPEPHRSEVLAVDLGADRVYRHRVDPATGRLLDESVAVQAPPGTGPRHLARHPDGRVLYLVGELSGTVGVFAPDPADGRLREVAQVPASAADGPTYPSEVAVGADGRYLYVANRGPDTVSVFAVEAENLRRVAEVPTGGRWPRHFALLGDHLYVANERSHAVTAFRVDPETGVPHPAGDPLEVGSPTCVLRWAPVSSAGGGA